MTDIYALKSSLNQGLEATLITIVDCYLEFEQPFFIAGATARDLVLNGLFGHLPLRATRDVDTAICMSNWEEFYQLKEKLIHKGFQETSRAHRLLHSATRLPIDLIPFGGLEVDGHDIKWPPEFEIAMSVAGFSEAYENAITVQYQSREFKVASLPGIALMKLIAWDERGAANSKDASDLFMIMHKYQFIHDGRVWDDYIPTEYTDDFESDVICAFLLGHDLSLIIREPSLIILKRIFEEKNESLITAIIRATNHNNEDQLEKMIVAFWCGVFENNDK